MTLMTTLDRGLDAPNWIHARKRTLVALLLLPFVVVGAFFVRVAELGAALWVRETRVRHPRIAREPEDRIFDV